MVFDVRKIGLVEKLTERRHCPIVIAFRFRVITQRNRFFT